jgi:hypothetical protein
VSACNYSLFPNQPCTQLRIQLSWILGALMILFGAIRVARPAYSVGFSWGNMVLGIWAFFSPWIYGYVFNSGRFINSLCVGVIVFVLSIVAATLSHRTLVPPATHA